MHSELVWSGLILFLFTQPIAYLCRICKASAYHSFKLDTDNMWPWAPKSITEWLVVYVGLGPILWLYAWWKDLKWGILFFFIHNLYLLESVELQLISFVNLILAKCDLDLADLEPQSDHGAVNLMLMVIGIQCTMNTFYSATNPFVSN